jgi:3-methyladenine DNA glycosylase AlkD
MRSLEYLSPLITAFESSANSEIAPQMEKYMRNLFPFFGIKSPERREIYKVFIRKNGLIPKANKKEIVQWCWQAPQREYQLFAMELLGRSLKNESENILDLYEYMIVTKSWWDTVDYIAINLVGGYFKKFPESIEKVTHLWMKSENMWLLRTCLLFQLKYKSQLNTKLLHGFISELIQSKEFFIQKAIGWILREYSKTNPDFVINYVNKYDLPPLSKRETLLWMKNKGVIQRL